LTGAPSADLCSQLEYRTSRQNEGCGRALARTERHHVCVSGDRNEHLTLLRPTNREVTSAARILAAESRSVSVGVGSVEVMDRVLDEFVVAHGGATGNEFVGLVVAEDGSDAFECSGSGSVDPGEVASTGECAPGEGTEERRGDVGPPGPGEGAEGPVQPRGELGSGAFVAPDDDAVVKKFQRAGVVAEAGPETAGECHDGAGCEGVKVELTIEVEALLGGGERGGGVVALDRPGGGVVGVGEDVPVA
jgi:hypothetical protein